ncbi:MAG TPA: flagellar hook assembly protein FlgD [Myxococcota bacterium]
MVSAVSGQTAFPTGNTDSTKSKNELGKDSFVRLLLTQLQSQDPTAPQSSEQFVAQLAQFTQVELAEKQAGHMESLLVAQAAGNQTAVAGLVGKDVSFSAESITTKEAGEQRDLSLQLPSDADSVVVSITDKNGKVVRTIDVGPSSAGKSDFTFDGMDTSGNPLPAGDYTIKVVAKKGEATVPASVLERGPVQGVSFVDGVAQLLVNGRKVSLPDVLEVNERGA